MKYPLAITNRLLTNYGTRIALGYDIMCAFHVTLGRSDIAQKACDLSLTGVVPSFHGYAHNRACQLDWRPLHVEGTGLEDFEECERTFSRTNELAPVTRLATPYHRHQEINNFLMFHDFDKYVATGWYLLLLTYYVRSYIVCVRQLYISKLSTGIRNPVVVYK